MEAHSNYVMKVLRRLALSGRLLRKVPRGVSIFYDIRECLPRFTPTYIFDVGAFIGRETQKVAWHFPSADIFAFEPDPENFSELARRTKKLRRVQVFNFALGERSGQLRIDNRVTSRSMRHISLSMDDASLPMVEITTLDAFCLKHSIEGIDYLKIDTEGYDLKVLMGATGLLSRAKIGLVRVECSANCDNKFHVSLHEVQQFLEQYQYRLFGIYEQVNEWTTKKPFLRRVDAAFVGPSLWQ